MKTLFLRLVSKAFLFLLVAAGVPVCAAESPYWVNLSTDAMQWFIGPNGRLDFNISDDWSVGLAATYQDRMLSAVHIHLFSPGVYGSYAFGKSDADNWHVDMGAFYGKLSAYYMDDKGNTDIVNADNWTGQVILGHQWYIHHFTFDLGIGEEYNSAGHKPVYDPNHNQVATVMIPPTRFFFNTSVGVAF